jgi:hypothetical protein
MSRPESDFPTIRHLRDCLSDLVNYGLGDHPVQIVVVPDSTIQAIAQATGGPDYDNSKPVLLIELEIPDGSRLPVSLISTKQMRARSISTSTH